MPPPARTIAWFSAALFGAPAACPSADADMPPSAGAAPAVILITPAEKRR